MIQYYDSYHDPSTHLQLARQRDEELLREAERYALRPALGVRLRAFVLGKRGRRDVALGYELPDVIRELRALRTRLDALEARIERRPSP